jgi:outer membrane protein TolC
MQALLALLILFSAPLAAAPSPKALSLEEVLRAVREHSPEVAAAQAAAASSRGMALAAHAWMPPRLELELMGLQWPNPDTDQWMERRVGLTQELSFPGRTWFKGQAASRMADAQAVDTERVLRERLEEARAAYATLAAQQRLLEGLRRVKEATEEMSMASARRARFGQLDRMGQFMDSMLAMEDSDVASMLPMAEQKRAMAEAALARLMGVDPFKPLGPADLDLQALAEEPVPSLEQMLSHAEHYAPDLAMARAERASAEAARTAALMGWLPDLMLSGSVDEDALGQRSSRAMLGVSLPWIWAWGQAGEHQAASAALDAARQKEEATRLMLREDLRGHWGDLTAATEALRITLQQTLPRATQGLERARSGFKAAAMGPTEILMAVQDYRMVEEKLATLTVQAAEARAHLLHQAAALDADHLGEKP